MKLYNLEDVRRLAPSVFTNTAGPNTKPDSYLFVNTETVLQKVIRAGFAIRSITEKRVRNADNRPFAKHMIRLVPQSMLNNENAEYIPELVIVNGHNANSSVQLHLGAFRIVCSNGLVVSSSLFNSVRIVHSQRFEAKLKQGIEQVLNAVPGLDAKVKQLNAREFGVFESIDFANKALELRYPKLEDRVKHSAKQILQPKRDADAEETLWAVFNRVQEHLMQGQRGMRGIKALDTQLKLNKQLWALAESYL